MGKVWHLVRQNLKQRKLRFLVMTGSIALASVALFLAMALSEGIRQTLQTTRERLGADMVAVPAAASEEAQAALIAGNPTTFYMPAALEEKVRQTKGVRETSPQIFLRSLDSPCCVVQVSLVGYDPLRDFTISPWVMRSMSAPLRNDQILVGAKVISAVVGSPAKAIGQRLVFMGKPFTVAMILEPTGLGADYTVFLTLETAYAMTQGSPLYPLPVSKDQISTILIRLEEGADPAATAAQMEQKIPELKVFTANQLIGAYSRQLQYLADIFFVAGGILCFLALMLAGSLFTLSVRHRMRELGLLRAMGADRRYIVQLVVLEAVSIAGSGGLLGVLAGLAAVFLGKDIILELIGNMHTWPGEAHFLRAAALSLLAALAMGVLGGLYPAGRIGRMEPYEAIRRGE